MGDTLRPVHRRRNQSRIDASQQVRRIFAPHGSRYLRYLRADDSVDGARRHDTSHALIERGTQRIDVSEGPLPARRKLFDGRVARCEHGGERLCAAAHGGTGSAKIDQGRLAGGIDDDVGGLDVTMQETCRMNLLQPVQ